MSVELDIRKLWYILPGHISRPGVSRFRVLYITKSRPEFYDWLYLAFTFHIFVTRPGFYLYFFNINMFIHHVSSIKEGITDNIMYVLLEYCLFHKHIRLMSNISQLLYDFVPFVDKGFCHTWIFGGELEGDNIST